MPRQIGLGANLSDQGVDGDIDFDFFDEDKGMGEQLLTAGCCHHSKQADRVLTELDAPNGQDQQQANVIVVIPQSPPPVVSAVSSNKMNSQVDDDDDDYNTTFEVSSLTKGTRDDEATQKGTSVAGESSSLIIVKAELNREVNVLTTASLEEYENGELGEDSDTSLDVTVSESDSSSLSDDSLDNLSDSEITDVTPLSSTNNSPLPSSPSRIHSAGSAAYHLRRREAVKFVEEASKRPPPPLSATPLRNQISEKSIDLKILLQAILDSEKEQKKTVAPKHERSYSAKLKKNMSFTNEEVRRIDRENQLLLKKIFDKQSQRSTNPPGNTTTTTNNNNSGSHSHHLRLAKISSSGINRQRQQKKIEAENLMLLKRIQSVRPTRELSRTYLLKSNNHHHYHHHHHHYHHYHHYHHHNCYSAPSSRPGSHTSSFAKNRDSTMSPTVAIGSSKKALGQSIISTCNDIDDKL